jgi:predicted Zn-dependent protease
MADIADGVYVTELIGHGVNGVTGDYSRGASGFRIVNGEIAGPVAEFTVAGNLIDMFARTDAGQRSRMVSRHQRADDPHRRDERGGRLKR